MKIFDPISNSIVDEKQISFSCRFADTGEDANEYFLSVWDVETLESILKTNLKAENYSICKVISKIIKKKNSL